MRLTLAFAMACLIVSHAGASAASCAASAEEAARHFVTRYVGDPGGSVELLEGRSLARYRARLAQLLDGRYAPMSSAYRETLFGAAWTPDRLGTLSDAEFVGRYFSGGSRLRGPATIGPVSARVTQHDARWGDEVTVRYTVGSTAQERRFTVHPVGACWQLEVPDDAWARLDELARLFKASRAEPAPRQGPALLPFLATHASHTPAPGLRETKRRGASGGTAWLAHPPILTEANIAGAQAAWDCEMGSGPEGVALRLRLDDAGARALKSWSERHLGEMMAVALQGEVVTVARVAGVLGDRLTLCLHDSSLEEAEGLASLLRGVRPGG